MKRVIAILLVLTLILSYGTVLPLEVSASSVAPFTAEALGEYTVKDEPQEVSILIKLPGITSAYTGFGIDDGIVKMPDGFQFVSYSTSNTSKPLVAESDYVTATGVLSYQSATNKNDIPAETTYTAVFSVPGSASGEFEIVFGLPCVTDASGEFVAEMDELSVKFNINTPSVPAADYEIYYTLDSNEDVLDATGATGADGFMEYDVISDVTATVYMKNNTEASVTMQAYDIYLDYSEKLIYESNTLEGAVAYAADKEEAFNKENGDKVVDHIQLVKGTHSIELASGEAVKLGTIMFSFADGAAFDEELEITLVDAADANNSEKAEDVTNFSVGGTDEGDATSYYPVDVSEVKGVEVDTEHTVTFDTNGGSEVEEQTVGHNLTATKPEDPTKANYTFVGWYADEDLTAEFVFDTKITDDTTVYAKWEANTVTVKWFGVDGNVIETDEGVVAGTEAEFNGTTPSKTVEGYTVTFLGWNTDKTATTALTDMTVTGDTEFYPIFKENINQYTITFDTDGGNNINAITQNYGTTVTAPQPPVKTGYNFVEWNPALPTTMPAQNMEVKAIWEAKNVTVTLNANGGKVDGEDSVEVTEKFDAAYSGLKVPTREGYTFDGWYTQQTGGDKVTAEIKVSNENAHELFAHWTPITYTVKFDENGATSGTAPADIPATYGQAITMPDKGDMVKTDYEFAGWAKSNTATEPDYTANQSVAENLANTQDAEITLYAVWVQDAYTITYTHDPANVSVTSTLPTTYSSKTGLSITDPVATGYTFAGWTSTALNITEATKNVSIPAETTGEVDLKAHWTINQYTITFANTGDTTIEPITQDYGTTVTAPADPTKTGYTFAGWDVEIPATMPAEDVTITANWNINQYTITFEETGDSTIAPMTQDYGTTVTAPADPTKTGYTFAGWDVDGDGDSDVDDMFPVTMPAENVTIKALWTENQYTIKFNDTSIEDKTVGYDDEVKLPTAEEVTKDGYELIGWSTTENPEVGSNPTYKAGDTVSKLKDEDNAEITLYPVWKYAEYTLSFDLGDHPATGMTKPDNKTVTYNSNYPELPEVTADNGYKFLGWYNGDTQIKAGDVVTITADTELTAKYDTIVYTIQLNANGGTVDPETITYRVTDAVVNLPVPLNGLYAFKGWKVTTEGGSWKLNAEYDVNDLTIEDAYGNATLTAQWDIGFTYSVESYKYAKTGYKMLRIATADNTNAYKFGEETMYYTDNADYKLDGKAVFVTLIPINDGETVLVTDDNKLTDAAMEMITQTNGAATVIARDGDVNGDEVVNIADANVVYQMVQNGGSYYGNLGNESQSDILSRLEADMHTETNGEDFRGTLDDVDVIVNDINGTN